MNDNSVCTVLNFPSCYDQEAQIHNDCNDFKSEVLEIVSKQAFQDIRLKMCKIIVIGDTGVGKTSLIQCFCNNHFNPHYVPTIGVDFAVKRFEVLNIPFTLQMWDTAGQERFRSIATAYYRGADVIVIVFDLTNRESFQNCEAWLYAVQKENLDTKKLQIFLVGTKQDLLSLKDTVIAEKDAIQMAKRMHAEYWQVSSKSCENVKELFSRIAALAFETSILREVKHRNTFNQIHSSILDHDQSTKKFLCC